MNPARRPPAFALQDQEIPFAHPASRFRFRKPLVVTRAALATFGVEPIVGCYVWLQDVARTKNGLDYLQVFADEVNADTPKLWFMENAKVVTSLLPSDY